MASSEKKPIFLLTVAITITLGATRCGATSSSSSSTSVDAEDGAPGSNYNETSFEVFLQKYNDEATAVYSRSMITNWNFNTNITEYNQQQVVQGGLALSNFSKIIREQALVYNATNFTAANKRLHKWLTYIGSAALGDEEAVEGYTRLLVGMRQRYSTAEACREDGTCLPLSPDLEAIMSGSRDYGELYWAWKTWRDMAGAPARQDYVKYVELKNKMARANGGADCGAEWRSSYEVEDLAGDVEELYQQIKPLYENLHAYVRRKLYGIYGPDYINLRGPLPAHISGNMWFQTWQYLNDICEPFPNVSHVDVTRSMVEQNYTVTKMVEVAEEFFTSLGLLPLQDAFWNRSMFVKPTDGRKVACHPSAWDFHTGADFRLKMCTQVNMRHLIVVHHELGHIQYFMQYRDQPVYYHAGANSAFHEAIGDVMALSVSTPSHLHTIGLLDTLEENEEADLNYLMSTALEKIAFLPFAYLVDAWRWGVFNGTTPESKYNEDWWKLRLKYQGIIPPTPRTEEDFDPGAKYHVAGSVAYIRYFLSYVIQFQIHEALCKEAGHVGPLYKCDIYGSKEAGTLLANAMRKGSSELWPDTMEALTGSRTMNASALVSYFQPLMDYLSEENLRNGDVLGWPEMYTPADPNSAERLGLCLNNSIMLIGISFLLAVLYMD